MFLEKILRLPISEPPAPNATNFLSLPQMMYHPTDGWTATLNIFYTDEVYILLPKTKVTKSFGSQTPVIITDPSFVPLADEDEVRAMQPNTDYKISVTRVHDDVTGVQVEGPAYKTTVSRSKHHFINCCGYFFIIAIVFKLQENPFPSILFYLSQTSASMFTWIYVTSSNFKF